MSVTQIFYTVDFPKEEFTKAEELELAKDENNYQQYIEDEYPYKEEWDEWKRKLCYDHYEEIPWDLMEDPIMHPVVPPHKGKKAPKMPIWYGLDYKISRYKRKDIAKEEEILSTSALLDQKEAKELE